MNCPQCQAPLPPDAPTGLCPVCLLKRALETNTLPPTIPAASWSPPSPAELASFFPELDLLEFLGRGGMGAVYKARQKSLDRIVALKILPPQISHDVHFSERFTHEAHALAKLNHAHIVTIYDFGRREGTQGSAGSPGGAGASPSSVPQSLDASVPSIYFFLMEFVDGLTLRDLLAAGTMTPKDALAIVPQICDALQYAHDRGIVHRDIKPENILLNRSGQIKIADFGLAKLMNLQDSPSSIRDSIAGTPAYMAPEQSTSPSEVDHRADIYALGVVFYQMLTGQLPPTPLTPPSSKVQIDVRLDDIVLRALEKSPQLRYQNATQFKTEVETFLASPSPARPAPAPAIPGTPNPGPARPTSTPLSESRQRAQQDLRIPSIGLRIAAVLNLCLIVLALVIFLGFRMVASPMPEFTYSPLRNFEVFSTLIPLLVIALYFPLMLFIIFAAARMVRLKNYSLCVAGCILAIILSGGNLLILPFAIWSLILLARRDIREAFQQNAIIPPPPPPSQSPPSPQPALPLPPTSSPDHSIRPPLLTAGIHALLILLTISFFTVYVPQQIRYLREFQAQIPVAAQWTFSFSQFLQHWTLLLILPLLATGTALCFLAHYLGGRTLLRIYSLFFIAFLAIPVGISTVSLNTSRILAGGQASSTAGLIHDRLRAALLDRAIIADQIPVSITPDLTIICGPITNSRVILGRSEKDGTRRIGGNITLVHNNPDMYLAVGNGAREFTDFRLVISTATAPPPLPLNPVFTGPSRVATLLDLSRQSQLTDPAKAAALLRQAFTLDRIGLSSDSSSNMHTFQQLAGELGIRLDWTDNLPSPAELDAVGAVHLAGPQTLDRDVAINEPVIYYCKGPYDDVAVCLTITHDPSTGLLGVRAIRTLKNGKSGTLIPPAHSSDGSWSAILPLLEDNHQIIATRTNPTTFHLRVEPASPE